MVPLFIISFGQSGYADWLTINSYTGFVILSDFGFSTVMAVYLTNHLRTKKCFAVNIWNSYRLITLVLAFLISVILYSTYIIANFAIKNDFSALTKKSMVFFALLIYYAITILHHLILTKLQIYGKFDKGMLKLAFYRIVEVFFLFLFLILKLEILTFSIFLIVVRIICTFNFWHHLSIAEKKLNLSLMDAPKGALRSMLIPSWGVASLNIASTLGIQGSFIVSSFWLNPSDLVAISISRMIASPIRTLSTAFLVGTLPDYIISNVTNNALSLKKNLDLRKKFHFLFIIIILLVSVVLLLISPLLWNFMAHDVILFSIHLVSLFILATILDAIVGLFSQKFLSLNQAQIIGNIYLPITLIFLILQPRFGIICQSAAVPITIIATDLSTLILLLVLKIKPKQ